MFTRAIERRARILSAAALGAVSLWMIGCSQTTSIPPSNPQDAQQVSQGKNIYAANCARCHGNNLEGQPNWRRRKADGKLPAPPHDETGHTWHHPDQMLFGIIQKGLVPPYAPADYVSDMPAFGSTLSDSEIAAVLAYVKSRWPEEQRAYQSETTANAKR